jgi:hypothetical protein
MKHDSGWECSLLVLLTPKGGVIIKKELSLMLLLSIRKKRNLQSHPKRRRR